MGRHIALQDEHEISVDVPMHVFYRVVFLQTFYPDIHRFQQQQYSWRNVKCAFVCVSVLCTLLYMQLN